MALCKSATCRDDHALHLSGEWPATWSLVLVKGAHPYLNIEDGSGKLVASIDKRELRRLAKAIAECLTPPAERSK